MSSDYQPNPGSDESVVAADVERATARYVFAISTLSAEHDERVATGDLHEHLDVAPASVTEMAGKLEERGLVDYEKYRGVRLTDPGRELASAISWRLCVVTSFFDSTLNANLDEDTAFDIGVTLPERGIDELRERIETTCLDVCPEAGGQHTRCLT